MRLLQPDLLLLPRSNRILQGGNVNPGRDVVPALVNVRTLDTWNREGGNSRGAQGRGPGGVVVFVDRPQREEMLAGLETKTYQPRSYVVYRLPNGDYADLENPSAFRLPRYMKAFTWSRQQLIQYLLDTRQIQAVTITPKPRTRLVDPRRAPGATLQGLSIKKALNWVKNNKSKVLIGAAVVGGAYWAQKQAGGWSQLLTKDGWAKVGTAVKAIPGKILGTSKPAATTAALPAGVTSTPGGITAYTGGGTGGGLLDQTLNIAGKVVQVGASALSVAGAYSGATGQAVEPPNLYNQAMASMGGYGSPSQMAADLTAPPQLLGQDPQTGELVYSNGTRTPPPMQGGAVVEVGGAMQGGGGSYPTTASSGTPAWLIPAAIGAGLLVILMASRGHGASAPAKR